MWRGEYTLFCRYAYNLLLLLLLPRDTRCGTVIKTFRLFAEEVCNDRSVEFLFYFFFFFNDCSLRQIQLLWNDRGGILWAHRWGEEGSVEKRTITLHTHTRTSWCLFMRFGTADSSHERVRNLRRRKTAVGAKTKKFGPEINFEIRASTFDTGGATRRFITTYFRNLNLRNVYAVR